MADITPTTSKRDYVVLQEHKSTEAPANQVHLTVVDVVEAHDRESAITTAHKALEAAGTVAKKPLYRAIPLSQYDPAVGIKIERVEKVTLERKAGKVKPATRRSAPLPAAEPEPEASAMADVSDVDDDSSSVAGETEYAPATAPLDGLGAIGQPTEELAAK